MSSFFTTPASQRKRKRDGGTTSSVATKRSNTGNVSGRRSTKATAPGRLSAARDESISGSEDLSEEDDRRSAAGQGSDAEESDYGDETAAEQRLRLAERYLENIREEAQDEVGFDAADLDRDIVAERLREDVAEVKGRLYRYIAKGLDFCNVGSTFFKADTLTTTAVSCHWDAETGKGWAYTASKDMAVAKWEILAPTVETRTAQAANGEAPNNRRRMNRDVKQAAFTKGNRKRVKDLKYLHHTAPILCMAVSPNGRYLATGSADGRLIVWSTSTLESLRAHAQHRDAVTALAFRRGTNTLFSGSKDRTIKIWEIGDDGGSYLETLFGHQDEVVDVHALSAERCVSVGARDRTARFWKVTEETQLVFRGGGEAKVKKRGIAETTVDEQRGFAEGSIDRIAMVDDETFVTGSDNGSLSLWSINKKKPVFTRPLAHGADPPPPIDELSAEQSPDPKRRSDVGEHPRWITALACVPYSDLIVSGSWDGWLRVWKIAEDRKSIEELGIVGGTGGAEVQTTEAGAGQQNDSAFTMNDKATNGTSSPLDNIAGAASGKRLKGVVNDISIFERGERGKDGLCIVAALGKEHRLGRWLKVEGGKNGGVVFQIRRRDFMSNGIDQSKL